nr:MAG TPA: hypothetical protein [Caudoviricetes sp.]
MNSIAQFCYRRGSLSSTSYGFPQVQTISSPLSGCRISWIFLHIKKRYYVPFLT